MGSHSLGVTQSLMYAFSRACMVFTTANSSAMLSYLRSASVRPWRQSPRSSGHQPRRGCALTRRDPTSSRPSAWGWGGGWTHFSRSRAFLYSFTSCRREGPRVSSGGGPPGQVLLASARQGTSTTHLIQLRLVSRGCNRAGRGWAGWSARPGPSPISARLLRPPQCWVHTPSVSLCDPQVPSTLILSPVCLKVIWAPVIRYTSPWQPLRPHGGVYLQTPPPQQAQLPLLSASAAWALWNPGLSWSILTSRACSGWDPMEHSVGSGGHSRPGEQSRGISD